MVALLVKCSWSMFWAPASLVFIIFLFKQNFVGINNYLIFFMVVSYVSHKIVSNLKYKSKNVLFNSNSPSQLNELIDLNKLIR